MSQCFDVQSIEISANHDLAFDYIADRYNLPAWAYAFSEVSDNGARLRTPTGEVDIQLDVQANKINGVIDWIMTFPDGTAGKACSRVIPLDGSSCIYSFTLLPPQVPLEELEGTLDAQSKILSEELNKLKGLVDNIAT